MKKTKKSLSVNIKILIAFILGGIIFGGISTAIAYAITASNASYDNTTSGSSATNVQEAVGDLYIRVNGDNDCKIGYTKQNESSTSYECVQQ